MLKLGGTPDQDGGPFDQVRDIIGEAVRATGGGWKAISRHKTDCSMPLVSVAGDLLNPKNHRNHHLSTLIHFSESFCPIGLGMNMRCGA